MPYNNKNEELQYEIFSINKTLFATESPYGVKDNLDLIQLNKKIHSKVIDIILKLMQN